MATYTTNPKSTADVVSVLNGLIETCKDGETGFQKAAQDVNEASLATLFTKYSTQRAAYAQELQQVVTGLGEKPETTGHIAAGIHRGWLDIKKAVSKREDKAIVDDCEAGEDAAMKNYKEALAQALPANILQIIERQFAGVQQAHNTVRDLKHSRQ